ncbi:hypothetical protein CP533_5689 [Ophiocordyceps camponoti-saundersi (nom. inval.)]|nr:hypothetical protein CP533_5689 [Ophiocordyceps camponoti-saundersi (nom. inval.)]
MHGAAVSKALMRSRVIFSGIQPTGIPHLGNYVGALRQWSHLQEVEGSDTRLIFSIVDLHALTTPQCLGKLKQSRRETLAALLATGIDPTRCSIFYQSSVPAHSELMWILACTASVGYLSRMTQWKQKLNVPQTSETVDRSVGSLLKLGLLAYPVLQAADVLVHRATHVPVGHDQQQHIEFARECATNFNHTYEPCLVHPDTITPFNNRIMSLTDPTSKMSKSHKSERSRILVTDSPDEVHAKVASALTDSVSGITYDVKKRPGISNLLEIFSVFDSQRRTPEQLAQAHSTAQPRQLKTLVANAVVGGLLGIREKYLDLLEADNGYLEQLEAEGAEKARQSAQNTMDLVRNAIGL